MLKLKKCLRCGAPINITSLISGRRAAIFAAVFVCIGVGVVVWSYAAGPLAAFEPENGSLAGCATKTSNANASGGAVAKFGPCPTPTPTATLAPTPTPTATPAGACSSTQPSGTGITAYQGLAGSNFAAKVNAAPGANVVSLAGGTFGFSDFASVPFDSSLWAGSTITGPIGLIGSGVGNTILQMNANSSTKAGSVPTAAGTTNQLYLLVFNKDGLKLSCFTLNGTNQGHLYNGIRLVGVSGATLSNLKLVGTAPGNSLVPPGETFAINDYHGANNTYSNIEIDGAGTGASAFGANGDMSASNNSWIDDYAHDNPYSAGIALWQLTGTQTLTRFRSINNRTGINLERMNGIVNINQPTLKGSVSQDFFIGNDKGSAQINIYDPILDAGKKVRIFFPAKEQGNPNIQNKADIKVFVNGVDVSSTMIQYL